MPGHGAPSGLILAPGDQPGALSPAPSHQWPWPLQTKTQKPDTLAPQAAGGTENGGRGRASRPPAYSINRQLPSGGLLCPWCLGSKQIIRAHYRSPPGYSHPPSSCWLVKGTEKDVLLKRKKMKPLRDPCGLGRGTFSVAFARSGLKGAGPTPACAVQDGTRAPRVTTKAQIVAGPS